MPRPISSMVRVAMKDGTFRMVTSTPLMRPMMVPSTRQKMVAGIGPQSLNCGANRMEKATPIRPLVEPTDRSRSLLMMTKVMPTATTA